MSSRFRNDFINEESFGVEANTAAAVAATTVPMDNGFTFTAPVAGTCARADVFEGQWLYSHTGGAAELNSLISGANFNMVIGQPIRFIADLTFQLLATELNLFVGCRNDMIGAGTAPIVTLGAGMAATGQHFGFYTPASGGTAFANDDRLYAVSMHNDTVVQVTELSAANTITRRDYDIAVGTRYQLQADWVPTGPRGGTTAVIFDADIQFTIDGETVAVHHQNAASAITPANTDLMNFGIATENITDIITLEIRQLKCRQLRALSQFGG